MSSLILTVGLPRSGKTTWALAWWRETGAPIVSPDAIRLALHGQRFQALAEPFVWAIAKVMVRALFAAGHPTVTVDATNTTRKRRDEWRDPAWEVWFHEMGTSAADCRMRARAMGDEEIIATIDRMEAAFEPITDEERGAAPVVESLGAEARNAAWGMPDESKVIDLMAALKASLDGICVVCAGTGREDRQPVSAGGLTVARLAVLLRELYEARSRHTGSTIWSNVTDAEWLLPRLAGSRGAPTPAMIAAGMAAWQAYNETGNASLKSAVEVVLRAALAVPNNPTNTGPDAASGDEPKSATARELPLLGSNQDSPDPESGVSPGQVG